ncbi:MAG: DNA-formamidopyrimidine glycosylase family protein, partial [Streptosporangiaceae bacterium]
MPELPEVEYIARQLRVALVGRTLVTAEVLWPRAIATPDAVEFAARVAGQRVTGIGRRAKYLLIELRDGAVLTVHRRMTGNLILAGAAVEVPYTRVRFTLDDGWRLVFTDPRKFGRLALVARADLPHFFRAIGPEPLDDAFTPE